MVVDNFCAEALFESIDLYVNHELVTSKSLTADNYLTSLFLSRSLYNEPYSDIAQNISGIFNDSNMDTAELSEPYIESRRRYAEKLIKNEIVYYRYDLCLPLNLGLGMKFEKIKKFLQMTVSRVSNQIYSAKQNIPLPPGVPIQICFNRAKSSQALINTKVDTEEKFESETIVILSPTLACYFVESVKADNFY